MDIPPWQVVVCPFHVRFSSIRKEYHTLGRIYAIYSPQARDSIWVSQSITGLVQCMVSHGGKLQVSSIYRILRGQCICKRHKGLTVRRLESAEELNDLIDEVQPRTLVFAVRDPDNWQVLPEKKC